MNVTEADKEQMGMYHDLKTAVRRGRIQVLNINESTDGITITVKLSKKEKSIEKIRQDYNQYGDR